MNDTDCLIEYVDEIYAAALQKTGDSYLAEEIAQETFVAALQRINSGKTLDNLRAWLYSVLSNKYNDLLRGKYKRQTMFCDSFTDDMFEFLTDESAGETGCDDEQLDAVMRELGYLARTHREVMVRFYIHGEPIHKIAREMSIPVGTAKSRLNASRRHIRERIVKMEKYGKQSYEPVNLIMSCSGQVGLNGEPFCFVQYDDRLTQNVLIAAYEKPMKITEISELLGVPAAYIEPVVEKMVYNELMSQTDGGRYYTDFIIFDEEKLPSVDRQVEIAEKHFELFWKVINEAVGELESREWFVRQNAAAKNKLKLHFVIKLLQNATVSVRDEVAENIPFADYPYRKNNGRWFAMGWMRGDTVSEKRKIRAKYSISGEAARSISEYKNTKMIIARRFETELGRFDDNWFGYDEYLKWYYDIYAGTPEDQLNINTAVIESTNSLIECGILARRSGKLELDIPVLNLSEDKDECMLQSKYVDSLANSIRDVYLPVFEEGRVILPPHFTCDRCANVPKWIQYMNCGNSIQMAVIFEAIKRGLLFAGISDSVGCTLPAAVLVIDK